MMTKLGLDSFSYHVNMSKMDSKSAADWFLNQVVELGLRGCQFDPMHLNGWNEDLIRYIGSYCSRHSLYLELGSGGFDYERLSKRLLLASEVGARTLRTFIGGERYKTPPTVRKEWIGYTIENFQRLAEVAEKVCVPIALENHEDLTSEEIISILDAVQSPYIRALVDNGNALPVGENPVDCARRLAPYACACHLKDWKFYWESGIPMREGCPLGQGNACVAEVYHILRSAQPEMPITIEVPSIHFDHTPQDAEQEHYNVVESIQFIRNLDNSAWNSYSNNDELKKKL
jgi:sugar phosphate isomerase/epimerase